MFSESCSLGRERKAGGIFHLNLNIASNPIANKSHEGKVQSTLERELNVPELVACQAAKPTRYTKVVHRCALWVQCMYGIS